MFFFCWLSIFCFISAVWGKAWHQSLSSWVIPLLSSPPRSIILLTHQPNLSISISTIIVIVIVIIIVVVIVIVIVIVVINTMNYHQEQLQSISFLMLGNQNMYFCIFSLWLASLTRLDRVPGSQGVGSQSPGGQGVGLQGGSRGGLQGPRGSL